MRRGRRGGHSPLEFGGSGEDSFVAVVVTKLTGALLFILLLAMVIMALLPKAAEDQAEAPSDPSDRPLAIVTPERLPDAVAGRPYALALAARGGDGGASWTLDGALPPGLHFDPATAVLSGTPEQAGEKPARLVARVQSGSARDARALTLAILGPDATPPVPWTARLPRLAWNTWLEQGFGFLLLLLVHLVGLNSLNALERFSLAAGGEGGGVSLARYRWLRGLWRGATLTAALVLIGWLWMVTPR